MGVAEARTAFCALAFLVGVLLVVARQRDRHSEQAGVQRLFDSRLDLALTSQLQPTEGSLLGQAPAETHREQAQQGGHDDAHGACNHDRHIEDEDQHSQHRRTREGGDGIERSNVHQSDRNVQDDVAHDATADRGKCADKERGCDGQTKRKRLRRTDRREHADAQRIEQGDHWVDAAQQTRQQHADKRGPDRDNQVQVVGEGSRWHVQQDVTQKTAADADGYADDCNPEQVDAFEAGGIHGSLQATHADRDKVDGKRQMKGLCGHPSILPCDQDDVDCSCDTQAFTDTFEPAQPAKGVALPESSSDSLPASTLDRRIVLETAVNMRDLGGLDVAGGVFTPGQLFRSASLSDLSPDDGQRLGGLGVTVVYDLRTSQERETQPDRLPTSVQLLTLDVLADASTSVAAMIGKLRTAPETMNELLAAGTMQQMLTESYRDFIRLPSALAAYRELFLGLADRRREGTALFHCTAGKDRTGWAAASLLMLLGADEATVHSDYLQTNDDLLPTMEPLIRSAQAKGVDPDLMRDAFRVRASYLDATLEEIVSRYGSIDSYFTAGLELSDATLAALRERFVA